MNVVITAIIVVRGTLIRKCVTFIVITMHWSWGKKRKKYASPFISHVEYPTVFRYNNSFYKEH